MQVPKPPKRDRSKRKSLKRSWIKRGEKPLKKVNVERQARVDKQRRKQRNSPAEKEARRIAWSEADGICQCGCGRPFDLFVEKHEPDYPEFHHDSYRPPRGKYVRRGVITESK